MRAIAGEAGYEHVSYQKKSRLRQQRCTDDCRFAYCLENFEQLKGSQKPELLLLPKSADENGKSEELKQLVNNGIALASAEEVEAVLKRNCEYMSSKINTSRVLGAFQLPGLC